MTAKIARFTQLEKQELRLVLRAWVMLCRKRLHLSTKSFKDLVEGLTVNSLSSDFQSVTELQQDEASRIGRSVRLAARYTPWRSTCLVQVLAAQELMDAHGIPGVFFMGADKTEQFTQRGELSAHAWLKCGDRFVTGEAMHERFTVIASFSWV